MAKEADQASERASEPSEINKQCVITIRKEKHSGFLGLPNKLCNFTSRHHHLTNLTGSTNIITSSQHKLLIDDDDDLSRDTWLVGRSNIRGNNESGLA